MRIALIDIQALITRLHARARERPDLDCNPDRDIDWAENLTAPIDAQVFSLEIIFVICNSGMRFTTARDIYNRVVLALRGGRSASRVFDHVGKAAAIDHIWKHRLKLYYAYNAQEGAARLVWLERLPWIGPITKYHVAKNFGLQFAKPDVHLQRLADAFNTSPQALCEVISKRSGLKVATVDTLLWRAAACGVLDTSTGRIL